VKLLGYMPDADPLTDGALLDCDGVLPTYRGISSAPSQQATSMDDLSATCIGAASLTKINGDTRTFAAFSTHIKEQSGTSWADVSENSVSGYPAVTDRWRFAQYGNVSLAVAKEVVLQKSDSAGNFGKVTSTASGSTVTAPSASIVETVNDFVFLCDTTGVPGFVSDQGERWIASALGDYTDWTPSAATQCVTGTVKSVPGKITAARRFGDQIVLYKERGMFVGSYVGPPVIWQFPELPTAGVGTFSQESVCHLGTPEQPIHFFVGRDDFYMFDGARVFPVGRDVKDRFFAELNLTEADRIICLPTKGQDIVRVFYPSSGAAQLNACLTFNFRSRRWGRDDHTVEYAFEYLATGVTYDDLGSLYSTYDDLPSASYDEAFQGAKTTQPAVFDTTHGLNTLTGTPGTATLTPAHFGSDQVVSRVTRINPRWITRPDTASLDNYYWMDSGDTPTLDTTVQMSAASFDFIRSARWHKFDFAWTGSWETNVMAVEAMPDGAE
jgi:hypothetical protein